MAGQALSWDSAPSSLERFNKPLQPIEATTYGFKGFPEMHMMEPKQPLRHQHSADVTTDVNRYFRKDSPTEWLPSAPFAPQAQQQKDQPDWLHGKREPSPSLQQLPPQSQLEQGAPLSTISPRYQVDGGQTSYKKPPVIRDPLRELTSAERRKKIEEHYLAEQDLAEARRRKEEQMKAKREEQLKIREMQEDFNPFGLPGGGAPLVDNRKTKFTEYQLDTTAPTKNDLPLPKFGDENRGTDRVRSSMDQIRNDIPEKKEELLEKQSMELRKMKEELDRLQGATDDIGYGTSNQQRFDTNPRAQSEPQTDRTWRRQQRDRDIWGESNPPADYLNVSPRRRPVGVMYNKESTYKQDFDPPFIRRGRRNLGNPNQEPYEPFSPFGSPGGGAPLSDAAGQRRTRIQGSMAYLGRELSDSARARRAHKSELLNTIGEQAAYERARREAEKAYARQGFVEVADVMRQQKVGYPKFKPTGMIDNHHLPHTMSNPYPHLEISKQREYHDFLASQIEEKNRNTQLGQLEEKRQAREHFLTQDNFFGRRGGGNMKGDDLRKVNLDKAIHNPLTKMNYAGGAPYAEFGNY